MTNKLLLMAVGGAAAGIATEALVKKLHHVAERRFKRRVREEVDRYEIGKALERKLRRFEKYEEEDLFFDEDLDEPEDYKFYTEDLDEPRGFDSFPEDLDGPKDFDFYSKDLDKARKFDSYSNDLGDDELEMDFIDTDEILSAQKKKTFVMGDEDPISKETVMDAFILLIEECWIHEGIHTELDTISRQKLIGKELKPIEDKLYNQVLFQMAFHNESTAEVGIHTKKFGEDVLDTPACKIMTLQMGSIRKMDVISLVISHELWLTKDGAFVLMDRILEGNDEKAYEFLVFMGDVYELYDLNISYDDLLKKIRVFAEHGCD